MSDNTLLYPGIYRGKVLDNDDPSQLCRIKAEIYPMLIGTNTADIMSPASIGKAIDGIETSILPWAVPAFSLLESSASGVGAVSVPKVGSMLFFFFEAGDIYQPVYFASAPDAVNGIPSEVSSNYPNKKVLKTPSGFIISLDDTSGAEQLSITHPAGTVITVDSSGNVSISSSGNVSVTATRIDLN